MCIYNFIFFSFLGVVFSVILSIVLIGLAFLLMWKFFTSMRDRREFAKFEKERAMAKWDSVSSFIYVCIFFVHVRYRSSVYYCNLTYLNHVVII